MFESKASGIWEEYIRNGDYRKMLTELYIINWLLGGCKEPVEKMDEYIFLSMPAELQEVYF